jgi:hypothetical protein
MTDIETRLERLEQRDKAERAGWAKDAAAAENWHRPDDAERFVDLGAVASREDVAAAVRAVTEREPYLAKTRQKPRDVNEAMGIAAMDAIERLR